MSEEIEDCLLRFYTDENWPLAVVIQLRQHRIDVVRCQEVGLVGTLDDAIHLAYAAEQGRIVLTRDQDFLRLHANWMAEEQEHAGIVFVNPGRHNDIGLIVSALIEACQLTTPEEWINIVRFL